MSTTPLPVTKIDKNKSASDVAHPGQLDQFPDGSWEFTGNGESTPKDVATAIINVKKTQPQQMDASGNAIDYAQVRPDALAKLLLSSPDNTELNKQLNGDVNQAIPAPASGLSAGKTTFRADDMTLQQAAQLLLKHADSMRAGLAMSDSKDETQRVTGSVRSQGLILPYEP